MQPYQFHCKFQVTKLLVMPLIGVIEYAVYAHRFSNLNLVSAVVVILGVGLV